MLLKLGLYIENKGNLVYLFQALFLAPKIRSIYKEQKKVGKLKGSLNYSVVYELYRREHLY